MSIPLHVHLVSHLSGLTIELLAELYQRLSAASTLVGDGPRRLLTKGPGSGFVD